jgi:hypothetical protein
MVDLAVTLGNGGGGDRVIIRGQYLQLGSQLASYPGPTIGLAMGLSRSFLKPGERAIIPHSHGIFRFALGAAVLGIDASRQCFRFDALRQGFGLTLLFSTSL